MADPFGGQASAATGEPGCRTGLNPSISGGTPVDEEKTTEGIMALQSIGRKGAATAAVIGLGALLVGCSRDAALNNAQLAGASGVAPLSVSCEPNQRAVVRQIVVNGGLQSQVQCETAFGAAAAAGYAPVPTAQGVAYSQPIAYAQPVAYAAPLENARLVQTAYPPQVVTRQAAPQRVVSYQPAREREIARQPKRSVKKSAVIIGSSAGVGAGIGAIAGGKKGAGIGALIGGGGAALWDQITRRK
jgi:hypothetical protein